jgi:predicted DsbA family dithiol-disulfide isomerase
MKRKRAVFLLLILIIIFGSCSHSHGLVLWNVEKTLQLDKPPVDVAVSDDGRWIYVLTERGDIFIYSGDGTLKDKISVGKDVDGIKVGPQEDILLLSSIKNKTVDILVLDFVQDIDAAHSPFKGPPAAPVEIAVFSDFQCPYCARFASLLEQVFEKYSDSVKLVYKNFPLRSHNLAFQAALYGLAADKQGKFWQFHDELYKNNSRLSEEKMRKIAQQVGLHMGKLDVDLRDPKIKEILIHDYKQGVAAGIRGIPTAFVNGKLLRNRSFEGLQTAIEKEISRARKKQ